MSLVSILIPTYNQPEFFKQALDSALNQTYPEIEIIVSDDSTDDRVKKICEEYIDSNPKFPIRYFDHSDFASRHHIDKFKGFDNQINLLRHARGEFINFLYHDDLFYPTKIQKMMYIFDHYPNENIAFVTSRRDIIDENGKIVGNLGAVLQNGVAKFYTGEEIGKDVFLLGQNFIGEPTTVLFRRDELFDYREYKFIMARFYGKNFRAHFDLPTWLEMIRKKDRKVVIFGESLSAFRHHAKQNSADVNLHLILLSEWIEILSHAFLNDLFIHNANEFKQAYQIFFRNQSVFPPSNYLDSVQNKYNREKFSDEDFSLLKELINAALNEDSATVLYLANRKKSWESW